MHSKHNEWRHGPLTNSSVGFKQIGQHSAGSAEEEEEELSSSLESSWSTLSAVFSSFGGDNSLLAHMPLVVFSASTESGDGDDDSGVTS